MPLDNPWTSIPLTARNRKARTMGAELVGLALARWTHVSDRAFRVLMRMSLTALDRPSKGRPAAVYLGGRELLAMTLRSDKGTAATHYRAVQRALAELSEEGAIQHLKNGWAGQNAVYRLTLEGGRKGGSTDHPVGGSTDHPMGGPTGTEWVVPETTPRNQEELQEEPTEEETWVDLRTTSHPPHATAADSKNVIPFPSSNRNRHRERGQAEIAIKAAQARDRIAAIQARRQTEREAT
jgi:hypothetical protein